ncbi:MAG: DUF6345 domain-containing protein [Caldisericum sp.]
MKKYNLLIAVVFILSLSICGLSFFNIYKASASGGLILYSGFDGVDGYQSIGGCNFGDRYGVEYVNKLKSALGSGIFISSFSHADKYAWENDLTGINANSVDFFAFAGHGVSANFLGNGNAAAHFFTQNSSNPPYHPSHYANAVNADWSEISWGSHGGSGYRIKWATMYCCNFLTNFGNQTYYNNLKHIFNGVHLVMGFASEMWLDSNEGTKYGQLIAQDNSFKYSFFTAAYEYQNGHLSNTIARVMGANISKDDKWDNFSSSPDPFLQHPEEYSYWDEQIN